MTKAFGEGNHLLWKTLPIQDYNNRIRKVYDYYFYPENNFIKEIDHSTSYSISR